MKALSAPGRLRTRTDAQRHKTKQQMQRTYQSDEEVEEGYDEVAWCSDLPCEWVRWHFAKLNEICEMKKARQLRGRGVR